MLLNTWCSSPSGAIASIATNSLVEIIDNQDLRRLNLLEDELCDTHTFLHLELGIGVVEENDANIAPVIRVYDSSSHINMVLPCQARARSHTPIVP